MALDRRYELKGLDLRNNELIKEPGWSTACLNVEKDHHKDIVKRNGYASMSTTSSIDLLECKKRNELIKVVPNSENPFYKWNGTTWDIIRWNGGKSYGFPNYSLQRFGMIAASPIDLKNIVYVSHSMVKPGINFILLVISDIDTVDKFNVYLNGEKIATNVSITGSNQTYGGVTFYFSSTTGHRIGQLFGGFILKPQYTTAVSYQEIDGNLYIADPEGVMPLMKYDGSSYYAAGLIPFSAYISEFFKSTTLQTQAELDQALITIKRYIGNYLANQDAEGTGTVQTCYIKYAYSYTDNNLNEYFGQISGSCRITNADIDDGDSANELRFELPRSFYPTDSALKLNVFQSSSANGQYVLTGSYDCDDLLKDRTSVSITHTFIDAMVGRTDVEIISNGSLYSGDYPNLEAVYGDETRIRIPFPVGVRYSGTFQGLLFAADKKNVYYSNPDEIDIINPDNVLSVEENGDGDIKGIDGLSNTLAIFKERSQYNVIGDFDTYSLRVQRIMSNIGLTSHKSIIKFEDTLVYMTQRGIYVMSEGRLPVEISENIEKIFTDNIYSQDFSKARTLIDVLNERILIFIPGLTDSNNDRVYCYKYAYKEWYIYDSIHASNGFLLMYADGKIRHSNGTKVYLETPKVYNDDGVLISSFYKTMWENNNNPSMRKKYLNIKLLSMSDADVSANSWQATIATEEDYVASETSNGTLDMSNSNKIDVHNIDNNLCHSMRFKISNAVLNEGMLLTGIELEVQPTQQRMKD